MKETFIIVLITAAIIEFNHYLIDKGRKKATTNVIMGLMNDISVLSHEVGHNTWVDYFVKTYGKEEALFYLGQLQWVFKKNLCKSDQSQAFIRRLGEYLEGEKSG